MLLIAVRGLADLLISRGVKGKRWLKLVYGALKRTRVGRCIHIPMWFTHYKATIPSVPKTANWTIDF